MVKRKGRRKCNSAIGPAVLKTAAADESSMGDNSSVCRPYVILCDLKENASIWYRLRVLIYDLKNIRDPICEKRTLKTVDPLYLSAPYFSAQEAHQIKACITGKGMAIEQAITQRLENFLEKRRASGDSRPCGPHDLVPAYMQVFEMQKADIEDENFISRVRRTGLS